MDKWPKGQPMSALSRLLAIQNAESSNLSPTYAIFRNLGGILAILKHQRLKPSNFSRSSGGTAAMSAATAMVNSAYGSESNSTSKSSGGVGGSRSRSSNCSNGHSSRSRLEGGSGSSNASSRRFLEFCQECL